MRTPGGEVVRGRSGRSLFGGGLSRSSVADGVAVLVCCTAFGLASKRHNADPRIRRWTNLWLQPRESVRSFGVSRHPLAIWSVAVRFYVSVLLLVQRRASAFQAGHIPSCCMTCECLWVLPTVDTCRWLLLLLSPRARPCPDPSPEPDCCRT
jgi:hypothetical protein